MLEAQDEIMSVLTEAHTTRDSGALALRQRHSIIRRVATSASARTPVLPEAAPLGPLSAHLRRLRSRSAMSASRRLQPSGDIPKAKFLARTTTGRHRQSGNIKRWLLSSQRRAAWLNEDGAVSQRCGREELIEALANGRLVPAVVESFAMLIDLHPLLALQLL